MNDETTPTTQDAYAQILAWDNLLLAWQNASRGKRGKNEVARFELRLGDELIGLQRELADETYAPGRYVSFHIHEPKKRLISAAPFRDRVVHHALMNVAGPRFERLFHPRSYANRVGWGTHAALDWCQTLARRHRYVLPCDVRQFFPSIDHAILRETLARMLPRDPRLMTLIGKILRSGEGVLSEAYDMTYFAGDDLFAALRPRGLPIGNLTSQWWANCYMNDIDWFVTRGLGCRGYVRYVDDMLLFGDDPGQLHDLRDALIARCAARRLSLHEAQAHARPVSEGVSFLGFIVFPTHRRLKRRKGIHFLRKLRAKLADGDNLGARASLSGWINHVRYGDTWGLRRAVLASTGLLADDG
jgi:hypothetical protein